MPIEGQPGKMQGIKLEEGGDEMCIRDRLRIRYRWKVLDAENQAIREHRQKKTETKSKAERERIGTVSYTHLRQL